jgi:hypothetical protein
MPDDKALAAVEAKLRAEFAQWLDSEWKIYLAQTGDNGTIEDFREHVRGLTAANPDFVKLFLEDCKIVFVN